MLHSPRPVVVSLLKCLEAWKMASVPYCGHGIRSSCRQPRSLPAPPKLRAPAPQKTWLSTQLLEQDCGHNYGTESVHEKRICVSIPRPPFHRKPYTVLAYWCSGVPFIKNGTVPDRMGCFEPSVTPSFVCVFFSRYFYRFTLHGMTPLPVAHRRNVFRP